MRSLVAADLIENERPKNKFSISFTNTEATDERDFNAMHLQVLLLQSLLGIHNPEAQENRWTRTKSEARFAN